MFRIIRILILFVLPVSAWAVDLSIDQDQQVLMPNGKPKMVCDTQDDSGKCTHTAPLTIGLVIQSVLVAPLTDPSGRVSDPGNPKAGSLAIRIYGQKHPTLTHDEFALILSRTDRTQDPITIARMHEFLEPVDK
jgi:hypothetical protein